MPIRPFHIQVSQDAIDDLQARLRNLRWPGALDESSWEDGTGLSFMKRLVDHWLHRFDWRVQESNLNRLPHSMAMIDGAEIHFVHKRSHSPSALPLILTHGWPGSFIEMERILPLLTEPERHGGKDADAFHVVVPSLPGFGFSPAPRAGGISSREIAQLWHRLMAELGYSKFACQGGDIGAGVSIWLARQFPASVIGAHLNYIPGSYRPPLGSNELPVSPEEQAYLDRSAAWIASEGAYAAVQGTKPQTLAFSLTDSPLGLAAWIVEKMRSWSDCDGDLESIFSLDTILTDVCLYWFGNTLEASLRLYKENRLNPLVFRSNERVIPPMGMAHFPRELPVPPRRWLARVFDVRRWRQCRGVGTLRRWRSRNCWRMRSESFSDRCGLCRSCDENVLVLIGPGLIGQAIARRVGTGKRVLLADVRRENAERAAEVMSNAGFDVSTTSIDVTSRESVQTIVRQATEIETSPGSFTRGLVPRSSMHRSRLTGNLKR